MFYFFLGFFKKIQVLEFVMVSDGFDRLLSCNMCCSIIVLCWLVVFSILLVIWLVTMLLWQWYVLVIVACSI